MNALEELRGFVRKRAGISMGPDKDYLVRARLEPQLREWGVTSLNGLAERVRTQPNSKVAASVVAALTTNETLWFRDSRPFDNLRKVVLPDLVKRRAAQRGLAIWSAACSTGQEVYSIMMTLRDEEAQLRGWTTNLLASDICEPALERARKGRYSQFEVQRGMPIQRLVRDFEQVGAEWQVRAPLREGITFRLLNLLELPPDIGPFDIVFCRNVLIYFEVDVKARVLSALAQRSRPGGYLFLGGAETTLGITQEFLPVSGVAGLYQKRG